MQKFSVTINFETEVSESAADELEYLVNEFVESMLNVVENDGSKDVPRTEKFESIFVPNEGSDAPVESDGATDFDRR